MAFLKAFWQPVKLLFYIKTGLGKRPEALAGDSEAAAAVFLPLVGFIIGIISAGAAVIVQGVGLYSLSIVAGILVLVIFGGMRQFNSIARLFSTEGRATSAAVTAVLVLLFEIFSLSEIGNTRGYTNIYAALLYLPVAGALAMVSAASVSRESEGIGQPLSCVKGLHMLLSSILAFMLMLPQFGFMSLVFMAASVLAGSAAALLLNSRGNGQESVYVASIIGEILFIVTFILLNKPQIFY